MEEERMPVNVKATAKELGKGALKKTLKILPIAIAAVSGYYVGKCLLSVKYVGGISREFDDNFLRFYDPETEERLLDWDTINEVQKRLYHME